VGSEVQPIIITSDEVRRLGKNPRTALRIPEKLGRGSDAYVASIEVFHHLHCLDELRREISYKHYHEAEEGPAPGGKLHEAHISHCIDVLAQALRCTGSVDMITFNWVQGHKLPQPDFSNRKVCRDFDALLNWADSNGLSYEEYLGTFTEPPVDAVFVPET
jgi:hypothetical protein